VVVRGGIRAPIFELKFEEAEILKYASNAYHAAKVVFAMKLGLSARIYLLTVSESWKFSLKIPS